MSDLVFPAILTIAAIVAALSAYRGIRRGGARFYTLERESMLKRASFALLGSTALFLAAMGLMFYSYQKLVEPEVTSADESPTVAAAETPELFLETQPPTPTTTPTPDPNIPTPTPTAVICRAIVDGTSGSGLTLRENPAGAELAILPDGTILTLLETESKEVNGFIWRNVRTVAQEEGWVVEEFLKIGDCR